MNLTDIISNAKDDIAQGAAWLSKVMDEHVPALVAEAERIQSNPIVAALEGLVFPAEVEQEIVNVIKAFASVLAAVQPAGQPVPPAVVAPADVPADVQSAA